MNKKLKDIFEPNLRLTFLLLVIFSVLTYFCTGYNRELAVIEVCIIFLLFVYSRFTARRKKREIMDYIESITSTVGSVANDSFHNLPLPMVVFTLDDKNTILSANENFLRLTGQQERFFEVRILDVVPTLPIKWLIEGKTECPQLVTVGAKQFRVYGSIVRAEKETGKRGFMAATYWVDVTEYARIAAEFSQSHPVFAIIMMDNYDEFFNSLSNKDSSSLLSTIDDCISNWANASDCGGFLRKYDRDRYMFIFEERYLQTFIDNKFSLLDSVREIANPYGIHATVSIGIGRDGKTFLETQQFASLSIDMALSRGGDQAVVKNRYNFDFYGGKSSEMEKRTKVKSRVMANSVSELISEANDIYIMGHKYADLDTIGAAVGLCCIARKKNKAAKIVVDLEKNACRSLIQRMQTLPEYADTFVSPQKAILDANGGSLLIIVDTNRPEQVESEPLLMSCNHIAVVDHHRRAATYIQNAALNFHEPYASSASELVTEMLQYVVEQSDILRFEAEALLSGIVLDTKNFTLRTGGRTFDAAAFLRRAGADTTEVKRLLQNDIKTAMARYSILQKARVYKEGIAIAAPEIAESRIIAAQAADELLNISGIQASFVVFPEEDAIAISARSIGDINVQVILEMLGGGGNKSTAGAQIRGVSHKEAVKMLLTQIDKYLEDSQE